jgi:hypothetical protein
LIPRRSVPISRHPVNLMTVLDPVVFRELPMIQKIIADETWLESERRGCPVPSHDPVVRENVCLVILRVGAEMRRSIIASYEAALAAGHVPLPVGRQPHAA